MGELPARGCHRESQRQRQARSSQTPIPARKQAGKTPTVGLCHTVLGGGARDEVSRGNPARTPSGEQEHREGGSRDPQQLSREPDQCPHPGDLEGPRALDHEGTTGIAWKPWELPRSPRVPPQPWRGGTGTRWPKGGV